MRVLFIIDPLPRHELGWVTSYAIIREFAKRNLQAWCADALDIHTEDRQVFADARQVFPIDSFKFRLGPAQSFRLEDFNLVFLRKDPPFDTNYLYLTYLLELAADKVPIVNHPRGIRNTNEKIAGLKFAGWMPKTIVTNSSEEILAFQKKIKSHLVIKPMNLKAGEGVFLLKRNDRRARGLLRKATKSDSEIILAQEFLHGPGIRGDKRILILNGEILSAFEKHFRRGDFRANLSLGGTFHPAKITAREKALVRNLKPYFLKEKLYFVGIDVMMGKLIEMNVTSPAGIPESELLYPQSRPAQKLVDFLQTLLRR